MSTFMNNLRGEANKTVTTNGDVTHLSTFNANLDFFGSVASKRGKVKEAVRLFENAWYEDRDLAIKNLFYLRDVRGGQQERKLGRVLLQRMVNLDPTLAITLLTEFVAVGRWDDLLDLYANVTIPKQVQKAVVHLFRVQLKNDLKAMKAGKEVSLLAKWLPSISASNKGRRTKAKLLAKDLYKSERTYRHVLTDLRKYIDVVERRLPVKDYTFDYNKLTAGSILKYQKAFYRNDSDRIEAWKNSLKTDNSAKEKLGQKMKTRQPYELTSMIKDGGLENIEMANLAWDALPKETLDVPTLVVRDGSGSMMVGVPTMKSVTVLDVADALTIYASERLNGAFKDKFITFSNRPDFVDLSNYKTLEEKVHALSRYDDVVGSTNIEATYDLIYKASLNADPADYVKQIVIISDMEFNQHSKGGDQSTYDAFKAKFDEAGIPFPTIIYWNVNVLRTTFPSTDIVNTHCVSGFSGALFDEIAKGLLPDAVAFMEKVLSKYDYLDTYLK